MAEYFPLIDRAVSGLTEPTDEARRSIYERARGALIGQLRRMEPPVPGEDIAREEAALDEAIARVEARFADAPAPDAPPIPSVRAEPRPPAVPPVVPSPARERPVLGVRPAAAGPSIPPRAAAPPAAARANPPPRGTRPVMALRPVTAAPPAAGPPAGDQGSVAGSPVVEGRVEAGLPAAGRLTPPHPRDAPSPEDAPAAEATPLETPGAGFAAALAAARDGDATVPSGPPVPGPRVRDPAALRPQAPRPHLVERRLGWPAFALIAIAVLVMAGVGFAAYRLRDRPEQVTAARAAPVDAAVPGKVAERAAPAADAAPDTAAEPTTGASVPVPVGQGLDTGAGAPAIAVAQRAALLVDAPDDPQRVRTYLGTVVWHLDSVSPGQGQPLATAVKADVDIPEAKLKVTMLLQKNPEPQLPASHTIEFHFLPQPGNALGPVKQVNVPEMRKDDDAQTGDPLSGVPVAITDNYFLVGLSRGGAEGQNVRLMTERNWFDMGLLFTSGKLGKLTFEKGAGGQRVLEDALKAWK